MSVVAGHVAAAWRRRPARPSGSATTAGLPDARAGTSPSVGSRRRVPAPGGNRRWGG